jgi:hypothetical protein
MKDASNDLTYGMPASDFEKMFDVRAINVGNGLVSIDPKPGTPMSWAMPWVEIDLKTGKPIRCGTDD